MSHVVALLTAFLIVTSASGEITPPGGPRGFGGELPAGLPVDFGEFIATGGTPPYSFTLVASGGSVAPGIGITQIAPDRIRVGGTATSTGSYSWIIRATDATGALISGGNSFTPTFVPAEQSLTCTKTTLSIDVPAVDFNSSTNNKTVWLFAPPSTPVNFTIAPVTAGKVMASGYYPYAFLGTIDAATTLRATGTTGTNAPLGNYLLKITPLGAAGSVRVTMQCGAPATVLDQATTRGLTCTSGSPPISVKGRH